MAGERTPRQTVIQPATTYVYPDCAGNKTTDGTTGGRAPAYRSSGNVDGNYIQKPDSLRQMATEKRRPRNTGSAYHNNPRQSSKPVRFLPGVDCGVLVCAKDKKQRVAGAPLPQHLQRPDSIGRTLPPAFDCAGLGRLRAGQSKPHHVQAVFKRNEHVGSMRRNCRRHEQHAVESELTQDVVGNKKMPEMNGIERAAEDSDAHLNASVGRRQPGKPALGETTNSGIRTACGNLLKQRAGLAGTAGFGIADCQPVTVDAR